MKSVRAGLAASVLNEVLNGLTVHSFEDEFDLDKCDLETLRKQAVRSAEPNQRAGMALSDKQAVAIRKILMRTLDELGPDEFQTRTGHTFALGQTEAAQLGRN